MNRSMGGESEAAWRALLDDLVRHGHRGFIRTNGTNGAGSALQRAFARTINSLAKRTVEDQPRGKIEFAWLKDPWNPPFSSAAGPRARPMAN